MENVVILILIREQFATSSYVTLLVDVHVQGLCTGICYVVHVHVKLLTYDKEIFV